jgi:hypothetical protein
MSAEATKCELELQTRQGETLLKREVSEDVHSSFLVPPTRGRYRLVLRCPDRPECVQEVHVTAAAVTVDLGTVDTASPCRPTVSDSPKAALP